MASMLKKLTPFFSSYAVNRSRFFSSMASLAPAENVRGIVLSTQSDRARVYCNEEDSGGGFEFVCRVRKMVKILVGDRVIMDAVDWEKKTGNIESVIEEERRNHIMHPRIANVDRIVVVFSVKKPDIKPYPLTRSLVKAEWTGIPITIVVNKAELMDEETLEDWKSKLAQWGYKAIFASVNEKKGIDELEALLSKGETALLIGPSGVGKTSLINAIRGTEENVGPTKSGKRQRTSVVSLFPLADGRFIGDSPGFNKTDLQHVPAKSLAACFPEIRNILDKSAPKACKFKDCLHIHEPGCVVRGDWDRYTFYHCLVEEINRTGNKSF